MINDTDIPDIDTTKASNGDLRKKIRILDARLATLGKHLEQMGPYMQNLMMAHFHVLQAAHKQQKALHLSVLGIGPKQLMEVKRTLAKICDLSADFAAEYRRMCDPTVNTNHLVSLQIKAAEAKAAAKQEDPDGKDSGHHD